MEEETTIARIERALEAEAAEEQPDTSVEFASDAVGLRQAAHELLDARESKPEDIQVDGLLAADEPAADEIDYIDGRGAKEPVALREAAKDLAAYHRAQEEARVDEERRQLETPAEAPQELPHAPPIDTAKTPDPVAQQAAVAQAQVAAYSQGLATAQAALVEIAKTEMPEVVNIAALAAADPVRGKAAIEEFAQREPAKFARLQQLDSAFQSGAAQSAQLAAAQRAQHEAQFRAYAKQQDEVFERNHPELEDARTMRAAQDDALEYMTQKLGMSRAQLSQLYHSDPNFRSAQGQELIYSAVKQWRAERSMKDLRAHAKPTPPVIRPGTSLDRATYAEESVARLNKRLDGASTSLQGARIGAQLLKAQRAARG